MGDDLSLINTMQKSFKTPSKKVVSMPRMNEKKLHTQELQLKGSGTWKWDASCFKKGLLEKQQSVPNTCAYCHWKRYFIRTLEMYFSNISNSKNTLYTGIMWAYFLFQNYMTPFPPPNNITPPTKIKISDHPLWQRLFWNFLGGGACLVL